MPSLRSFAPMLLLAILWGLSIPVTKLGLETMPPLVLTLLRFAFALPLLFVVQIGKPGLPRRAVVPVAILGIVGIGVGQVTQTLGVGATSASAGTIISATIPLFVVVFAALRLRQPVTARQSLGLLIAFAGIGLVASGGGGGDGSASQTTVVGVALMLLSSVTVAIYYVWSVELTAAHGTATVATWSTVAGFVALLPWATWEAAQAPFPVTVAALAATAYLGVVVTVAGLFLWLHLLRTIPARAAAGVQFLQPVFGIAASALMFGDRLGAPFVAGVLMILAGLALAVMSPARPAPGPADLDTPPSLG